MFKIGYKVTRRTQRRTPTLATPSSITPVAYLKAIRDEGFAYNIGQHFTNWHSMALAPGSPPLPAGLSLSAGGFLTGTATVAGMSQQPVIRLTNSFSGLTLDYTLLLSVAQRPANADAPVLNRITPDYVQIVLPAPIANTPAVSGYDLMFNAEAVGPEDVIVLDAFPGGATTRTILAPSTGNVYAALRARVAWGDGTFLLPAAGFSSNIGNLFKTTLWSVEGEILGLTINSMPAPAVPAAPVVTPGVYQLTITG